VESHSATLVRLPDTEGDTPESDHTDVLMPTAKRPSLGRATE